ncbi:MAG: hypothetical protein ABI222_14960 [Opitutaceae bacterium]
MQPSTPFWPRGLLVGALLAIILIIPIFVVMLFDSAASTARTAPDARNRFGMFPRPVQMRASSDFFDGKLAVQAVLSQRFGASLQPDAARSPVEPRGNLAGEAPVRLTRSAQLRLRLENHSAQNLEIEIVRVASGLGDFFGQPDHVILAPHQTASIDSPVAEQKIIAHSIPVTIALRLDDNVQTQRLDLNDRFVAQVTR